MIDDLVKSLRPDDVTEASYQARRAEDLRRAFAARPVRRRTPLLAASGLLAAARAPRSWCSRRRPPSPRCRSRPSVDPGHRPR